MRYTLILLAVLALTGCRSFIDPDSYVVRAPQALPPPPPDKALVVFLWPDHRFTPYNVPLYQDEVVVGALRADTYFPYLVSPGQYHFATAIGIQERMYEEIGLTVHAGNTYFLLVTGSGLPTARSLDLIGEDAARLQLQGLQLTQLVKAPTITWWPPSDPREEMAANAAP